MIIIGEKGDAIRGKRPTWTKDSSFLVFRQLWVALIVSLVSAFTLSRREQLVPEWNKFIATVAPDVPGLTRAQSVALLGARMIGRWKSVRIILPCRTNDLLMYLQGAPVDLSPRVDNATLGADPTANNAFDYKHGDAFDFASDQSHCPFAAHIRYSRPFRACSTC